MSEDDELPNDIALKSIACIESVFPPNENSIDIVSYDIGTKNMGVARIRYDFATHKLCILNAMLLNIYHPFQMLNENDKDADTEFRVDAYYANKPIQQTLQTGNHEFSQKQFLSRKRARITQLPAQTLQFLTDTHPQNTAKRRRTKLNQPTISKALEKNWALLGAQLTYSIDAHKWMSDICDIDFILLEQQDRTNVQTRAIMLSLVTFYETKRLQASNRVRTATNSAAATPLWDLCPLIKVCSSSNKLGHLITRAMRTQWTVTSSSSEYFMTPVQIRALLKKHFKPPASDVADTSDYSKRKISSKDEVTYFFCQDVINRARTLSPLAEKCPENVIEQIARQPVNAYAHWIVNQLGEKNNVTDAILQTFAWIQLCE